jgi:hypothetical protein
MNTDYQYAGVLKLRFEKNRYTVPFNSRKDDFVYRHKS